LSLFFKKAGFSFLVSLILGTAADCVFVVSLRFRVLGKDACKSPLEIINNMMIEHNFINLGEE
jgi:hypothetical protein